MKNIFQIKAIGQVIQGGPGMAIQLEKKYIPGLKKTEGFSHLQVLWWGHLADHPKARETVGVKKLFKKAPEELGIFGTRSPSRPNPILISTIKVSNMDLETGIIRTPFIDAEPGTPVLDIKPYFPMERVRDCKVPDWFQHWPEWAEEAAGFPWEKEINFPS